MLARGKSKRKSTGAKLILGHKKKKITLVREPLFTKIGEARKKLVATRGGNLKTRMTLANKANVTDPKTGKAKLVEIKNVVENPANIQYVKRNIINKSSVIDTELGKARVTSRPGQNGIVNAVLIE